MTLEMLIAVFNFLVLVLWAGNTIALIKRNEKTAEDIAMIKKILHHITNTGTISVNDGGPMLMTEPQAKRFLSNLFDL